MMREIEGVRGSVLWRGEPGYEEVRLSGVWNGRKPDRYPAVIVRAADEDDVASAVRFAARNGLKVRARSGGHSWSASFLRDDAMLIDLGAFEQIEVDASARRVKAGPAVRGRALQDAMGKEQLFFPTGHCSSVGLGGFLLQGGLGWNGPALGLANRSVLAVELVTADGRLITASATENQDYFWAARGSGSGFFGIVTRFHLEAHPLLPMLASQYLFRREEVEDALRWCTGLAATLDRRLEINAIAMPGLGQMMPEAFLMINLMSYTESAEVGRALLGEIDESDRVLERALVRVVAQPSSVAAMYDSLDNVYVKGFRFIADNMYTSAPQSDVLTALLDTISDIPTPPSHVLWFPWPADAPGAQDAISVLGTNYIALYGASPDPADDERTSAWVTEHMRRTEHLSEGMQLGDENLLNRPGARILAGDAEARLEQLRGRHDPDQRFLSYLRG
jgi:FAD/FMN-containing dehydrogenase